jgi:hypothetical protein
LIDSILNENLNFIPSRFIIYKLNRNITKYPTSNAKIIPTSPKEATKNNTGIRRPKSRLSIKESPLLLKIISVVFCIPVKDRKEIKIINMIGKYPSRIKDNAGEKKSTPIINIANNKIDVNRVRIKVELKNSFLFFEVGKNLINPSSNPNRDKDTRSMLTDIMAVASPRSLGGIIRAATIQKSRPNNDPVIAFNIIAIEFRYSGSR